MQIFVSEGDSDREILGKIVRNVRVLHCGFGTRNELADMAGVPRNVVRWLEKDRGEKPFVTDVYKVVALFQLNEQCENYVHSLINSTFHEQIQSPTPPRIFDKYFATSRPSPSS